MPTISITVTAAQATRIQTAFGHLQFDLNNPGTNPWVPATAAEVAAELKSYIRERVRGYEAQQAQKAASDAVQAETDW